MKKLLSLILICNCLALTLSAVPVNLLSEKIRNFEADAPMDKIQFWWGKPVEKYRRITMEESYRGRSSLEVIASGGTASKIIAIPVLNKVRKGEIFTASAYLKSRHRLPLYVIIWTHRQQKPVEQLYTREYIANDWQQLKVTATLKHDADGLYILVCPPYNYSKDVHFFVDCVGVYRGKEAPGEIPNRIIDQSVSQLFQYTIPFVKQIPHSRADWGKALVLNQFYRNDGSGKNPKAETEIRMLHDGKKLYVRALCQENQLFKMHSDSVPGKPAWTDERIELHFNIFGVQSPENKRYFTVNSHGVPASLRLNSSFPPVIGSPLAGDGKWEIDFTIPAAAVGKDHFTGDRWFMSVVRSRLTEPEDSCLFPIKGHYGEVQAAFRPFVFADAENRMDCICLSRGALSFFENESGGNKIVFYIRKPDECALEVFSRFPSGEFRKKTLPASKKGHIVSFYYKVAGRLGEKIYFRLRNRSGRLLYDHIDDLDMIAPSYRTYPLADPLYSELLSDKKPVRRHVTSWPQPMERENLDKAMKYAGAYSARKNFKAMAEAGISTQEKLSSPYLNLPTARKGKFYRVPDPWYLPELMEKTAKGEAPKTCIYAYWGYPGQTSDGKFFGINWDKHRDLGWIADPINQQVYLDGVAETLRRHGKSIGIMWMGDELCQINTYAGLQMNSSRNLKNPTDFIRKADREVREKYGFGKFGIPWDGLSKTEDTPYCNRAYLSWLHDKIRDVGRRFRSVVKQYDPTMPVMCYSNCGDPLLNGFQYAGEFADIMESQLGENGGTISPFFQNYTYWVKLARDISGVDELCGCPHECDSGYPTGAASEDEMLEMYSQVFRGGGTGFAFWPASMGARRAHPVYGVSTATGYPLAWQYMLAISRHIATMPLLKFPKYPETAVLLSAESVKCEPSKNTADVLFTMLGPYSRGWFKFIADTTVELGRDRLGDYKIIHMPYAQYVKNDFPTQVADYVRQGGVVFCGDPQVFSNGIDAFPLDKEREKVFGIRLVGKSSYSSVIVGGKAYPINCDSFQVKVVDSKVRVLAKFADGMPAITEKKLGRGRAVYYAFRIYSLAHLANQSPWPSYFKKLHEEAGGRTGQQIWRFRFPAMKVRQPERPEGKCLTNNYAFWDRFKFMDGIFQNVDVKALCTVSRNHLETTQSVEQSKLTDRRTCFARTEEYKKDGFEAWVEDFSQAGKYSVMIDLRKKLPVSRLVFFWHGFLPENFQIESSLDGKSWKHQIFSDKIGQSDSCEVVRSEVSIRKTAQFIRMSFSKGQKKFIMAELELWN